MIFYFCFACPAAIHAPSYNMNISHIQQVMYSFWGIRVSGKMDWKENAPQHDFSRKNIKKKKEISVYKNKIL